MHPTRARSLTVLLAAVATAAALAMAPALPATDPLEEGDSDNATDQVESGEEVDPELYETCDPVEGATTITPEAGFDDTVPTPVGAANFAPPEDAGLYQLDLAGLAVGTFTRVRMVLSWDTPALGDYDLIVNGDNALSTDDPETHTRTLGHCDLLDLETVVFTGLPVDTLNLQVEVSSVVAPTPATPTSSPSPEPVPSPQG